MQPVTQLTTQRQLSQLRRALADVEARIIEMIAERDRLLSELRWLGQMEVDRRAGAWLEKQGKPAVESVKELLGCE